jgi:hypothetical protein
MRNNSERVIWARVFSVRLSSFANLVGP